MQGRKVTYLTGFRWLNLGVLMGTGCNPPLPIEIDSHLQKFDYEIAQFHDVMLSSTPYEMSTSQETFRRSITSRLYHACNFAPIYSVWNF